MTFISIYVFGLITLSLQKTGQRFSIWWQLKKKRFSIWSRVIKLYKNYVYSMIKKNWDWIICTNIWSGNKSALEFVLLKYLHWPLIFQQIIASENEPVRWTTPLGLPVVQPYRKIGRHFVSVTMLSIFGPHAIDYSRVITSLFGKSCCRLRLLFKFWLCNGKQKRYILVFALMLYVI